MRLYPKLTEYVDRRLAEVSAIPNERKSLLGAVADYVRERSASATIDLVFICTHNSRRSIMAQAWASVAFARAGMTGVRCHSGGTEVTAFNAKARAAMERAGFVIEAASPVEWDSTNPHVRVSYSGDTPALECFSKLFDDPANPSTDFAAIMTCSDAEKNCPFVPGATRFSLPYDDPGAADGTPEEERRYDERMRQIGTELLYLADLVSKS